jgi:exonuclease III
MKILSHNIRGMDSLTKCLSLHRLVYRESPDILLLQETMSRGGALVDVLKKTFQGWEFAYVESFSMFGGPITGWNSSLALLNYFPICSKLYTKFTSKGIGLSLTVMNMYGLYDGKQQFWDRFFSLKVLDSR